MLNEIPDKPDHPAPRSRHAHRLAEHAGRLVFADPAAFESLRGGWAERFRGQMGQAFGGRVIFEIGCADGRFLNTVAARHSAVGFIGLDWKTKAIADAADLTLKHALPNLLFIRGRAQAIGDLFAARELDEVWVFHPDPCDTEVERPNRLVNEAFLIDVSRVLRTSGCRFCLKTDHAEYFASVLQTLERPGSAAARLFDVVRQTSGFWEDADAQAATIDRAFSGIITRYEARFRGKRKPIHYLELAKR